MEKAVVLMGLHGPMVGILHLPEQRNLSALPVLLIVGGPQSRVGSHRQFLLLARKLCSEGVPVFRFDYSGMGDSPAEKREFLHAANDVRTAMDYFLKEIKSSQAAIWGLCDAASLALMYLDATSDERVQRLVLLNPWVRQANTEAQVALKSYYLRRVTDPMFWKKLIRLEVNILTAIREFLVKLKTAFFSASEAGVEGREGSTDKSLPEYSESSYVTAMKRGLENLSGDVALVISGNDLTADEFLLLVEKDPSWKSALEKKVRKKLVLEDANHTFSSAEWRARVESFTLEAVSQS